MTKHSAGRRVLGRRVLTGVVVLLVAAAIVVLPRWGNGSDDQPAAVERVLEEQAEERAAEQAEQSEGPTETEPQPPTIEDVRGLAAQLTAGDAPIDPDTLSSVVTSPGPYEVLGRLEIPGIDLDVEVGNGIDPATLEIGPGHWPGTPTFGQAGNTVVSGHRTTHTAPFLELDELTEGDEIFATTQAGDMTTYEVTEVVVVPVAEYESEVLAQPEDPSARELTLFACHPEGSLTHRVIVHARAAGS